MRSHESINAIKSLFSEEFQAKTIRARLENKKDICVLFLLNIYTQLKKTYSDITPSLTSFLGSEKKKREKLIIYIYIPLTGSSYFRFVATNINHLLLDPASL